MRGGRSLIVLLVLALGIGAYSYFVESKKDVDAGTKKDKVFTVDAGKIDELEIHAAGGDVTRLKKNGTDWQMVAPLTATADQGAASSAASTLESLEIDKALDDNPTSVADFGLQPPRFTVSFKSGGTQHTLAVGNKTPTGSDLYVQADGKPRLLLITSYNEDALNRPTFDFRDKTALTFTRDNVDSLSIEPSGQPPIELAKKDGDWRMTKPADARGDFNAVDGLLSRLSQAQMKSIVAGDSGPVPASDMKKYGLDKPQFTLTLGAGSTRATLAIGGKKDETALYARDVSKPIVFTVETALLTDLQKKPADLRDKDVFVFKSYNATTLDIAYGGTTYAFASTKPASNDASATPTWKETKPEAKDVNATGMTDFLNAVTSLRADSFTDKPIASGDDMVLDVHYGDATAPATEHVTLRKSGTTVQAIRSDEPGAAVVPTADFDKALTSFKELTGAK